MERNTTHSDRIEVLINLLLVVAVMVVIGLASVVLADSQASWNERALGAGLVTLGALEACRAIARLANALNGKPRRP